LRWSRELVHAGCDCGAPHRLPIPWTSVSPSVKWDHSSTMEGCWRGPRTARRACDPAQHSASQNVPVPGAEWVFQAEGQQPQLSGSAD
jgi:hypothetical protein